MPKNMETVKAFNDECRPEYKVPGLYVIDSVVRQSRHQFGQEKDVFMPRLCKNIVNTFKHLYKCPPDEKQRIIRVLHLWQKNNVFPSDIVQQLLAMGGEAAVVEEASSSTTEQQPSEQPVVEEKPAQPDTGALTSMLAQLLANPNNPKIQQLTGLLSSSQQAQLQSLVSQVQGPQEVKQFSKPVPTPEMKPEPVPAPGPTSVFQPLQSNSQPPFLQSEGSVQLPRTQPSFNRAILDYDYSDDESPKSQNEQNSHKSAIDMELLAKLPTVDQLKQLSSSNGFAVTQQFLPVNAVQFPPSNASQFPPGNPAQIPLNNSAQFPQSNVAPFPPEFAEQHPLNARDIDKRTEEQNRISMDNERDREDRSRSTSRRRRSRSRKRSRSRDRHRNHRRRSRSHDRHRSRRSRSHERHRHHRQRNDEKEKEREREKKGLPPLKDGCISRESVDQRLVGDSTLSA